MSEVQDNTTTVLEEDIYYYDNLQKIAPSIFVKVRFNAILHCKEGSIIVCLANGKELLVNKDQILLIPAYKMVKPIINDDSVSCEALFISDKMLKSLLGNQINIWNKAVYLDESYLIDGGDWVREFGRHMRHLFRQENHLNLFNEIMLSYLRTLLLIFCEALIQNGKYADSINLSTDHEKVIFNQFLTLLSTEHHKRQSVASCASELHITAKYLSTVCKHVSGKSPSKWITETIMEDCYSLLKESSLSIKEISNQLGFPNSSFFGQFFRKQAGITPMEYRNKYKNGI